MKEDWRKNEAKPVSSGTGVWGPCECFEVPATITLEETGNGEFLVVQDGTLNGETFGLIFSCKLDGKLDCSTNSFQADAIDGTYGVPPFSGIFEGTLDAQLNRVT